MKKQLSIFGSQVSYWQYGPANAKTTLVLIHGFRGTHHGLQQVIDALPQYRIFAPDLPGFDASSPMTERAHDINGYRDFTEEFIKQLGLKQPVLLGHSFGSIVTAAVAAHNPTLISKLILINAIAMPPHDAAFSWTADLFYWLGLRLPRRAGIRLLRSKTVTRAMTVLLAKTKNKQLRRDIHQKHLAHFSTFTDRDSLHQSYKASINHTAAHYASKITTPTLLIAGNLDAIAPPAGQQAMHKTITNSQLVMLKGVGHLIHYEKPAQAAKAIREFLG